MSTLKISPEMVKQMFDMASSVRSVAYAPYSKFYVGACVCSEDDNLFAGCNIENASYGLTQCAERCAINCAIAAGKKRIKAILVLGSGNFTITPCGGCRQVIREFAMPGAVIYLCDNEKIREEMMVADLLPKSFGPSHLEE